MQKFIHLGEGYGDVFELEALIQYNHQRIKSGIYLHAEGRPSTFILVMAPVRGNFQAIYTIYQGIPMTSKSRQKYNIINDNLEKYNISKVEMTTRDPDDFHDRTQYFQYMLGVLRLNNLIPPLS
jgi:hypothetical protein